MHRGMGYGRPEPDVEGDRTLVYVLAFNLLLGNTWSKKRDSHLIMYKSGKVAAQIELHPFPQDHAQTCYRCKSDPW